MPQSDDITGVIEELFNADPDLAAHARRMGLEMVEATPDRLVATMPVAGNTQISGHLFGGIATFLAEGLASVGAAYLAWPTGMGMALDVNATHHRTVSEGKVTAVAAPIHAGRKHSSWEVVITDDQERRVCTARITFAIVAFDSGA